jgi:type I restriction enzyme M protein
MTLERIFKNIEGSAVGSGQRGRHQGALRRPRRQQQQARPDRRQAQRKAGEAARRHRRPAAGQQPLGDFSDNSIDLFGDAYEYLMQMYASTPASPVASSTRPQEVSELLARITVVGKTEVNKVYDPACGSGSLLLKFAKVLGQDNVRQGFYGQEINLTTYNLCRINMFLHDVNFEKFDIAHGDTLTDPAHWDDEPFEAIVSNPPYSINWEATPTRC